VWGWDENAKESSLKDAGEFASLCSVGVGVIASKCGSVCSGGDGGSDGRRGSADCDANLNCPF
jgi:hypothetical protein